MDDRAVGVRARFAGQEIDIPARIVVDASDRQTLLGCQLRLKQNDKIFNQYAVHAWFENVERGEDPKTADYIHIYFLPVKRGWAWQIPITDTITSVGVVAERDWDVTGALRAGCAAVFIARPGQVMNPFGPQPDVKGAHLGEVAEQILTVELGQT